nr:PAS domain S-box protein [Phenylobacterium aquaticum]
MVPRLGAILSERDDALRSLAASEAEYRTSFESAAVGKVLAEPVSAVIQRVNPAFAHMLGYEPEDLVGTNAWDLSFPEDDEGARLAWGRLMSGEAQVYIREKPYRRRDGTPVWARISASVVRDDQGVPIRTYAVIENIDERRKAELAAREYEARLRLAVESAQIGVWEIDFAKGQARLDERASAMTWGQVPAEIWLPLDGPEFAGWVARIHPDDRPVRDAAVKAVREGAKDVVQMEYRVRRPDGAWGWQSHWRAIVERDPKTDAPTRVLGIIMDTTQRALAEVELRATLAQRDLLLREVYHRVKNNLQIVDGLVMMQARQLKDPTAAEALAGLRSRVYALGLVHHQLMASTNLETFDLGPFLQELVRNILDGGDHDAVSLDLDVEPLQVDFDFAIPLGLLVTELVTNALKHALRDGRGRIMVSCRPSPDGRVLLSVADDGPGRVANDGGGAGLGSIIIAGLVGQLDGEMTTRNAPGLVTEITLRTPERT